jgi:hypothetical protein
VLVGEACGLKKDWLVVDVKVGNLRFGLRKVSTGITKMYVEEKREGIL